MGQSDNDLDIVVRKKSCGVFNIEVSYWHKKRHPSENGVREFSSVTTYSWDTNCKELVKWTEEGKTKIFHSQIRVLCRKFGERVFEKVN